MLSSDQAESVISTSRQAVSCWCRFSARTTRGVPPQYASTHGCTEARRHALDRLARVRQPAHPDMEEARAVQCTWAALRHLRDRDLPDPCDRLLRVTDQNTHDANTQGFPLLSFTPP